VTFSDSYLSELAERNDIESVVSEYVRLTRTSGRSKFGLCPFHAEKTPSFSVNTDGQYYHCFGCGKGGGVISFIMDAENLGFKDAVAYLAKRVGMKLPEDADDGKADKRARLLSLNRDAARFFYDCFRGGRGAAARQYTAERQISARMVKAFGLGFAPDSWDALSNAMRRRGYTDAELIEAGLAKPRSSSSKTPNRQDNARPADGAISADGVTSASGAVSASGSVSAGDTASGGGIYDVFRNRLMFPVIDVRGSIIGFSGRILGGGEPKYLNSPETPVFSKSRNLFALNLAKKTKFGYIILTEGNIDVVSLHQAGFDCAVASLGTSLTAEQAKLIAGYKHEVVIAYDNDAAGIKAANRAITFLERLGVKVRVLRLTGAKDPDEYIKLKGADAFRNILEKSEDHISYRLGALKAGLDLDTAEGRTDFLKKATALLAELPGKIEREVFADTVAGIAGISRDAVSAEAERLRERLLSKQKKRGERDDTSPLRQLQPRQRALRYEHADTSLSEEGVIRVLMKEPSLYKAHTERPPLSPEEFSNTVLRKIYAEIQNRLEADAAVSIDALSQSLGRDEISRLAEILTRPVSYIHIDKEYSDYINKIRSRGKTGSTETEILELLARRRQEIKGYGG